jgi:hypothetical protein
MQRSAVPQPDEPMTLRLVPSEGGLERWELICRDGWDWQRAPAPQGASNGSASNGNRPLVWVRTAILTADQAAIMRQWLARISDPATWWDVSRALQTPEGSATFGPVLRDNPWLNVILPAVLEASTEGAPPPPPPSA